MQSYKEHTSKQLSHTAVGAKSKSILDIEAFFVILHNLTALHHNTNIFSYGNQETFVCKNLVLIFAIHFNIDLGFSM